MYEYFDLLQVEINKCIVLSCMNTIICPNCGRELSEAFKEKLEDEIIKKEREKHKSEIDTLKKEILENETKKLHKKFELQVKLFKEEALDKEERIKSLIEQITSLSRDLRESKREKDEIRLEMQKKLSLEEEKIRTDVLKRAEEENRLKLLEKDKQLQDALKEAQILKNKLSQGSQQTQGEAFELDFEKRLRAEFPNDKISEVLKGMKGADLMQEVWDRNGNKCGLILWELKNTKTWNEHWIEKLKNDQRGVKADYAVIVSQALPIGIDTAKYHKNVWISKQNFVIGLACALRMNLIQIAMAKRASEGRREKTDLLYAYLSGTEFRLRVEAIIEAFSNMQGEIEKEKRYFANKWARDEKNIRIVIDNTYGMHGDLKGIVGNTLPQIKGLSDSQDDQIPLDKKIKYI